MNGLQSGNFAAESVVKFTRIR
ncbi:hypothetical protein HKBW3S43_01398, partial [Candidatus Hakubella thermalkaliphila]